MNNLVKGGITVSKFVLSHFGKMVIYSLVLIIIVWQYFGFLWFTRNGSDFNSLMGVTKEQKSTVTVSFDELVSILAKTAVAEAKK